MLYMCKYCKAVYFYDIEPPVISYCCGAVLSSIAIIANTHEASMFGGELEYYKTDIYLKEEPSK